MDREAWIYGLYDMEDPGRIRYVGKTIARRGVQDRIYRHFWGTKNRFTGVPSQRWIRKIGHDRVAYRILEGTNLGDVDELERNWIRDLREEGQADLNVTPGGDGMTGELTTGESNPNSVLTWDIVREIRLAAQEKYCPNEALSQKYGVTPAAISKVVLNRTWVDRTYDPDARITASQVGGQRTVTDKQVEIIREEYLSGKTIQDLLKEHQIPSTTLRRLLFSNYGEESSRRKCLEYREAKPQGKLSVQDREKVIQMARGGDTIAEIAKRFGVTPGAIKYHVNRAKLR